MIAAAQASGKNFVRAKDLASLMYAIEFLVRHKPAVVPVIVLRMTAIYVDY